MNQLCNMKRQFLGKILFNLYKMSIDFEILFEIYFIYMLSFNQILHRETLSCSLSFILVKKISLNIFLKFIYILFPIVLYRNFSSALLHLSVKSVGEESSVEIAIIVSHRCPLQTVEDQI